MNRKADFSKHHEIILNSIADGVFTVDLDWRITSFNEAAERITGVSRSEAIGKLCHEVFKANMCQHDCVLKQTLKSGESHRNIPVCFIHRADNKRIPINVSTSILKDEDGHVIGGVEIFRDLTVIHEFKKELMKQHIFDDIVSKSATMDKLFSILPQIAQSDSTVLIEGASGTGKELVARAIHNSSPRKKGPFVTVNCGALPEALAESELFGYKAGAFTDAKKDKPGRFDLAENGTIFLDEIGDVLMSVQVRLLRVLEAKIFEPLGSTTSIKTNARVITATHRNLEELVKQGLFREDLFYRINVIKLTLPTLAERKEDIPLLVDYFVNRLNRRTVRQIAGLSQEAMAALMMHSWPGNIRELENSIEHAFVLCPGDLIKLEHLPSSVVPVNKSLQLPFGKTLKEIEKFAILEALRRNKWKRVATARELGIDKNTLRRKIKRLGLSSPY
jgi:PAS domain S-box-containing protein